MADADLIFEAPTPLGFSVRVTSARWELIVATKHPVMRGRESTVRLALENPDEVRQSRSDAEVLLFYKAEASRRWCAPSRSGPANARFSSQPTQRTRSRKGCEYGRRERALRS